MTNVVRYNPADYSVLPPTIITSVINNNATTVQTLENKTINADDNTIIGIGTAELDAVIVTQINDNTTGLATHESATTLVHGISGDVVGTTDVQILSNKILQDSTIAFSTSHLDGLRTSGNAPGHISGPASGAGSVVSIVGTDVAGRITVVPTVSAVGNDVITTVTLNQAWSSASNYSVVLYPLNLNAQTVMATLYVNQVDASNFTLFKTGAALTNGISFIFGYHVIGWS